MFERMSAFPVVCSFLSPLDSLSLLICNRTIRKAVLSICVPKAVWPVGTPFRVDTAAFVRQVVASSAFPRAVTYLRLEDEVTELSSELPQGLETVIFGRDFRHLPPFPSSLTRMVFRGAFSQAIPPQTFPPSLTDLTFTLFDHPLEGVLPTNLRSLNLGDSFSFPLLRAGVFPASLTTLIFGHDFDEVVEPGVLPPNLTCLEFQGRFNRRLDGVLPQSLQVLRSRSFNRPLARDVLPPSLRTLELPGFHQPLAVGVLPQMLTSLTLYALNHTSEQDSKHTLPSSLTALHLEASFDKNFASAMPSSLTKLSLGRAFVLYNLDVLTNLQEMEFDGVFDKSLTAKSLPPNLTRLHFGFSFNQPMARNALPKTLTELSFGQRFDNLIKPRVLPKGLRTLSFGRRFNRCFQPHVLPASLTKLSFGDCFNQALGPGVLPASLTSLELGFGFSQRLEPASLPVSLRSLHCPNGQVQTETHGYTHWVSLSEYRRAAHDDEAIPSLLFNT